MTRNKSAWVGAVVAAGLLATGPRAIAASSPNSAEFAASCTTAACNALAATFGGRIDWYSGGVLLFSEVGTFARDAGRIRATLSGNSSAATFKATYGDPMMTIFAAPNLSFKLYKTDGGDTLLLDQLYRPWANALWAKYSENAETETTRAIAAEDTLNVALNIEIGKRSTGDKTFQMQLDAEIVARAAVGTDLATEVMRAKAAELLLTNNLNSEIARATTAEATEKTRAMNAEAAELARATGAEMAEFNRAASVESMLSSRINIERDRAVQAEANELARATLAEMTEFTRATLAEGVELGRATQAENNLAAAIVAEQVRSDAYANNGDAMTLAAAKAYTDQRYSNKSCPNGKAMVGIDGAGNPVCSSSLSGRVKVAQIKGQGTCTYACANQTAAFPSCSCSCTGGGWWGGSGCNCSCSSTVTLSCSANSCVVPATGVTCPNVGGIQGNSELTSCMLGSWDNGNGCTGAGGQTATGPAVSCNNTETRSCSCFCTAANGWWGRNNTCSCGCTPAGEISCTGSSNTVSTTTSIAFCAQVE